MDTREEVIYVSDGSEVVTTLYNFENIKASITAATGIQNPTYCVTKPWFQNITEYIERITKISQSQHVEKIQEVETNAQMPFLIYKKLSLRPETCANDYCYKIVDEQVISECHSCNNLMSPAPETCNVNEYLIIKIWSALCC